MAQIDGDTTQLKLLSSRDEAGNVRTFVFESAGLEWIAGQNQGYVLPQAGQSKEENQRWFTIASAPSEGVINISTRISKSAFKQALNGLRPGDSIQAFSLDGDFTWEDEPSERVVLVAGGIGITPFRSILLERHNAGKALNGTLLYFNRVDEIPFRRELEELAPAHPEFSLVPIVGELITADAILERAPQAKDQTVYVSGPEPMVEAIGGELRGRKVTVKQDWFPGYDEHNY